MIRLETWQSFYTITGSAAGALIGLQFVVLALISGMPRRFTMAQGAAVYNTPTIVHFTAVLLLSSAMVAPWPGTLTLACVLAIAGLAGFVYSIRTTVGMRRAAYRPLWEDWIFHAVLPFASHIGLMAATVSLFAGKQCGALYTVAAVNILLLVIGIHKAWDTVTWHVFAREDNSNDNNVEAIRIREE